MNLGEIKAFLGDKSAQSQATFDARQQIREIGLRQAASFAGNQVSLTTGVFSSQTTIGLRVFNNALNQSLTLEERDAQLPKTPAKESSLFDFEEVAKNVLSFVGGAINRAAANGADDEKLLGMFEQARSGVLKGIKLAEKDLAGLMNDEIAGGISKSQELIEQGIQRLQDRLFNNDSEQQTVNSVATYESVNYSRVENGALNIRTRDGDEVTIRFEDFTEFEASRSRFFEDEVFAKPVEPEPEFVDRQPVNASDAVDEQAVEQAEVSPVSGSAPELVNSGTAPVVNQIPQASSTEDSENEAEVDEQAPVAGETESTSVQVEQNFLYREGSSFGFSVQGELDEGELEAIGNLVEDASDLATTFFDGDIEAAFQQALEIGYDSQELAGFALQLTRQEQVEVVNAYETVSHINEDAGSFQNPAKAVKPITDYLEKMLNVFEQSQQLLQDGRAYEQLINGIVNQVQDVETSDLLSAINQFHTFNKDLLRNLPVNQE